jgi:proteasome lid subunit RPN8/RPN11
MTGALRSFYGNGMPNAPFQRLLIPAGLYEGMLEQAQAERPLECCGLLAGAVADGTARVVERYPLVNAAASPVEYHSDARGMFEAVRDMNRRGLDLLAVYHSHPTSPPVPSRTDLDRNYSEDVVNLIISLATPPAVRGWWLTATGYREADWQIG